MIIGDYEINPYAAAGGGVAGAALGLGAYMLDTKKTKKKLATYIGIGSALGLGTGALASLSNYLTDDQKKDKAKAEAAEDIPMSPINMGVSAAPTTLGFLGGYGASRGVRELSARHLSKDDIQDIADDLARLGKALPTVSLPSRASRKRDIINQRRAESVSGRLGLGKGSRGLRTGRLLVDLASAAAGSIGANIVNNYIDK